MDRGAFCPSRSSVAVQASWAVECVTLRTSRGLPGLFLHPGSGVLLVGHRHSTQQMHGKPDIVQAIGVAMYTWAYIIRSHILAVMLHFLVRHLPMRQCFMICNACFGIRYWHQQALLYKHLIDQRQWAKPFVLPQDVFCLFVSYACPSKACYCSNNQMRIARLNL